MIGLLESCSGGLLKGSGRKGEDEVGVTRRDNTRGEVMFVVESSLCDFR